MRKGERGRGRINLGSILKYLDTAANLWAAANYGNKLLFTVGIFLGVVMYYNGARRKGGLISEVYYSV